MSSLQYLPNAGWARQNSRWASREGNTIRNRARAGPRCPRAAHRRPCPQDGAVRGPRRRAPRPPPGPGARLPVERPRRPPSSAQPARRASRRRGRGRQQDRRHGRRAEENPRPHRVALDPWPSPSRSFGDTVSGGCDGFGLGCIRSGNSVGPWVKCRSGTGLRRARVWVRRAMQRTTPCHAPAAASDSMIGHTTTSSPRRTLDLAASSTRTRSLRRARRSDIVRSISARWRSRSWVTVTQGCAP